MSNLDNNTIKVLVQKQDKLEAITTLCRAIESLAITLRETGIKLDVSNCTFNCPSDGNGISISTQEDNHEELTQSIK